MDPLEKAEAKGAAGAAASAAAATAGAAAAAADVAEGKSAVLKSKVPSLQCFQWAQSALSSKLYHRCVEKYPSGCVFPETAAFFQIRLRFFADIDTMAQRTHWSIYSGAGATIRTNGQNAVRIIFSSRLLNRRVDRHAKMT